MQRFDNNRLVHFQKFRLETVGHDVYVELDGKSVGSGVTALTFESRAGKPPALLMSVDLDVFHFEHDGYFDQKTTKDLSQIDTKYLVEELSKREGVETKTAEPYEDITATVNGPAIVLIVTD